MKGEKCRALAAFDLTFSKIDSKIKQNLFTMGPVLQS